MIDLTRVIDLTEVLSGTSARLLWADLGADVIKIEPPSGDVARWWGPHVTGDSFGRDSPHERG